MNGETENYIFAIGGWNEDGNNNSAEAYNISTRKWFKIAPMNEKRNSHVAIALNNLVYTFGGSDGYDPLKSGEFYDPSQNKWNPISPMSTPHRSFGLSLLDETIYVCGGFRSNIVELYNPTRNEWFQGPSMLKIDNDCFATVLEKCIYVMDQANCIERYDSREKKWTLLTSSDPYRFDYQIITYKNQIYRIGGGEEEDKGDFNGRICERFDIRSNQWEAMQPMNQGRERHCVVVIGDFIYAFGGLDLGEISNSVERYNPDSQNQWETIESMLDPRNVMAGASLECCNFESVLNS